MQDGPESGLARYLEYTDGHCDPGNGDEIALHPLLTRAQATAVIDHEARVPSLGYSSHLILIAVLQIRNVYPGSEFFSIPDPGSDSKNLF
jgi:hypothetical protein